jgi:hypothetical protein
MGESRPGLRANDSGGTRSNGRTHDHAGHDPSQKADALEEHLVATLDRRIRRSVLFVSGESDPTRPERPDGDPNQLVLMGDDPRLQKMAARPNLQPCAQFFGS